MKSRAFLLHALSPLHAGTGQSADVIDLPIARMRATGIPIVPGSTIKGVLRDARAGDGASLEDVFGPGTLDAAAHAGALVVGDARLLALPVRSFRGTFAWVSSPLLLGLAHRDLTDGGASNLPGPIAPFNGPQARVGQRDGATGSVNVHASRLYLEDLDLGVDVDAAVGAWGSYLARLAAPPGSALSFERRFVVVDDETMSFLQTTATQLDTRVRIDAARRTVADGALWIEESLPPETLLVGLCLADRSRKKGAALDQDQVMERGLGSSAISLQLGGKATVGRGRCRLIPVTA